MTRSHLFIQWGGATCHTKRTLLTIEHILLVKKEEKRKKKKKESGIAVWSGNHGRSIVLEKKCLEVRFKGVQIGGMS